LPDLKFLDAKELKPKRSTFTKHAYDNNKSRIPKYRLHVNGKKQPSWATPTKSRISKLKPQLRRKTSNTNSRQGNNSNSNSNSNSKSNSSNTSHMASPRTRFKRNIPKLVTTQSPRARGKARYGSGSNSKHNIFERLTKSTTVAIRAKRQASKNKKLELDRRTKLYRRPISIPTATSVSKSATLSPTFGTSSKNQRKTGTTSASMARGIASKQHARSATTRSTFSSAKKKMTTSRNKWASSPTDHTTTHFIRTGPVSPPTPVEWKRNMKQPVASNDSNAWVDSLDLSSQKGIKRIIKNLNEKINKLYNWHLVEIDLVAKQQLQINRMKQELEKARRRLAAATASATSAAGAAAAAAAAPAAPATSAAPTVAEVEGKNDAFSEIISRQPNSKGAVKINDRRLKPAKLKNTAKTRTNTEEKDSYQPHNLDDNENRDADNENHDAEEAGDWSNLLPPEVKSWTSSLEDEIQTSRMSLKHLLGLSTYKGNDFESKLKGLKKVFDHCDVTKEYVISPQVSSYFKLQDEHLRQYVRRCLQRLDSTKTTIQTFVSLLEEVGPKSVYVSQIRRKIESSGLLEQQKSPLRVIGQHARRLSLERV